MRNQGSGIGEKYLHSDPICGSWERGEQFAQTLLKHLKHNSNKRRKCNILLDHEDGDAPMNVNTTSKIFCLHLRNVQCTMYKYTLIPNVYFEQNTLRFTNNRCSTQWVISRN